MKVTDDKIIEALENNVDGKSYQEIAHSLGFTSGALSQRLSKLRERIRQRTIEYINNRALEFVRDLVNQSKAGKTEATKVALEMLDLYRQSQSINIGGKLEQIISQTEQEADSILEKIKSNNINFADVQN